MTELAQVLISVYYPGLSRNGVSSSEFEYLPGLDPVCKSHNYYGSINTV